MQHKNDKILQLNKAIGVVIKKHRKPLSSALKLSNEYDLDDTNLGRMEKGIVDSRISSIWKVSEALGLKCSEVIKLVEDELGEDFTLIDL